MTKIDTLTNNMIKWGGRDRAWFSENCDIIFTPYAFAIFDGNFSKELMNEIKIIPQDFIKKIQDVVDEERLESLEIPNANEIRTQIKELCGRKYSERVVYSFGENLPSVNARWLLNIIDSLNVESISCKNNKSPIEFIGKYGRVYLLPINTYDLLKKGCYLR